MFKSASIVVLFGCASVSALIHAPLCAKHDRLVVQMRQTDMSRRWTIYTAIAASLASGSAAPAWSEPAPPSINLLNPKVEFDGPLMADPASAASRLYAKNKAAEAASMAAAENRANAAKAAEEAARTFALDKEERIAAAKAKREADKAAFLANRAQE